MTDQTDYTKKPSGLRRVITWIFILALAVIVGLEFRGMKGYGWTLEAIESARETASEPLTVEKAKSLASLMPSYTPGTGEFGPELEMKWTSPLSFMEGRDWRIHLSLDGEGDAANVAGLQTEAQRAEAAAIRAKSKKTKVVKVDAAPPVAREKMTSAAVTKLLADSAVVDSLGLDDDTKSALGDLQEEIKQLTNEVRASASQPSEVPQMLAGMQGDWNVKLKNVVGEEAMNRLVQIELQRAGTKALLRPDIAMALDLSQEQRQTGRDDVEKLFESLTDEQKTKWQELVGEAFDAAE